MPTAKTVSIVNNEKKHKKFSIRDSQNTFLLLGETTQQLEEILDRKMVEKLPIQPLLLITGSIEAPQQVCVYYDNIRYKMDCVGRAVDICFKILYLFNLQYPLAGSMFWNFIQVFFYNIKLKNQHPSIKSLINELNLT